MTRLALAAALLLATPVAAQVLNPLAPPDNPLAAVVNPLAAEPAPHDPIAGHYVGPKFTLTLRWVIDNKYEGAIVMNGKSFPTTAVGSVKELKGTFVVGDGKSYEFTATMNGQDMNFTTEGVKHELKRGQAP